MKLLVVQAGKIGDLVVTTSLFNTLYKQFGSFDLVASAFAKDLLDGDTRIKKIYNRSVDHLTLKQEKYDQALILMPSYDFFIKCRRARIKHVWGTVHQHMTKRERIASWILHKKFNFDFTSSAEKHYLLMAAELGVEILESERSLSVTNSSEVKVDEFIKQNNLVNTKLVGISISAGKSFKEWGDQNYVLLVDWLIEKGYTVVGIGGPMDNEKVEHFKSLIKKPEAFVNTAGLFTLNQLTALTRYLSCFIGADTGPLYIADSQKIPVVDIMGPCPSSSQKPQGKKAVIVGECFDDSHAKCYMMNCPSSKASDYARCMQEISFEQVKQAFEQLKIS